MGKSQILRFGARAFQASGTVCLLLVSVLGQVVQANVPLTRADIQALRNRVEYIPRGRAARAARLSDFLAVGDSLRTAASSLAELRFNDGSLARVGERATFRFVPNTRNFRLSNGTMLLLIPPGRGRSTIQTPSAVTGIQGSAVVVRHIESRDMTIVMALTNNPAGPMTITTAGCSNGQASGCAGGEQALYAGQMAVVQHNRIEVLDFDLRIFHQTSPLLDGLELDNLDADSPLGPELQAVRQETSEALESSPSFSEGTVINPVAISIDSTEEMASPQPWLLSPTHAGESDLTRARNVLVPTATLPNAEASQIPDDVAVPALPVSPQPDLMPEEPGTAPEPPVPSTPPALPTPPEQVRPEPTPTPNQPPPTPDPTPNQPATPNPPGSGPVPASPPPFTGGQDFPGQPPIDSPVDFAPPDKQP
ncbi:FecR family protein [Nodosilinea sp. P-1105]|uniref:FecR family protein n=1 Tax=Nodosilinea sp. P-1105 TaxID=2546229 RepID=UPI00146A8F00|nr:FecR family protein [Nodosilinea sp. P-1105]